MLRTSLLFVVLFTLATGYSQDRKAQLPEDLKAELVKAGFLEQDFADVVVKDEYTTRHNGVAW